MDTSPGHRQLSASLRSLELIVHCDWSKDEHKRWMAKAKLKNGNYTAYAPEKVGNIGTLVSHIEQDRGPSSSALIGFDFPIGVPAPYADQIDIPQFPSGKRNFIELLVQFGQGSWKDFYNAQEGLNSVGLRSPFYPNSPGKKKGDRPQAPFLQALNVKSLNDLRRRCDWSQPALPDIGQPGRRAACPLFWTLGGNQVGKGAIAGWQQVLTPAVKSGLAKIWPFDGTLEEILRPGSTVVAETYPTQYHHRIFGKEVRGKRLCSKRKEVAGKWLERAREWKIDLAPELSLAIEKGFSTEPECEKVTSGQKERPDSNDDAFDAAIGLFGMIDAIQSYSPASEPTDPTIRNIEGWILGQPAS